MSDKSMAPVEVLEQWLESRLSADARQWLRDRGDAVRAGTSNRNFYLAISAVPRHIGKDDLRLTPEEAKIATAARAGWDAREWSTDQAARLALLLRFAGDDDAFATILDQLCLTADVGELVTFYRGLPLYPKPDRHRARAAEGARSNMKAVFEAVAHHNPYPADQFDDVAWNQMVLKALFIDSQLDPIQRLDERGGAALARMLCDYAHERWAAHRRVSGELWRCVGPHADDDMLADLARGLRGDDEQARRGVALSLMSCPHPGAAALFAEAPDLAKEIEADTLTWKNLSRES